VHRSLAIASTAIFTYISTALATIPERELCAPWADVEGRAQLKPGLVAWTEGAID
jgi:hypothetical protein